MEIGVKSSCNISTLIAYVPTNENPWNTTKIKHAYRRLGFGASMFRVDAALALAPNDFINSLVESAYILPPAMEPIWGNWAFSDFNDVTENPQFIYDWRLVTGNHLIREDLRGRLTLFWMNHFVSEIKVIFYAPFLYQYHNLMQSFSLGNFKEFVRRVGVDNQMLMYLNGFENTKLNPNENYARELFELFTLGEGNNYTQEDISETARALTGYNHQIEPGGTIYFDISTHDTEEKTIFNQTGVWGYDDVIDILFDQRAVEISTHICTKLYKYFVSAKVDATILSTIIMPLAQELRDNDWELVPMLQLLFNSEHFFDTAALGVIIKSPLDVIFNFINEGDFFYDDDLMNVLLNFSSLLGQKIYDPPDVSGWQQEETWINNSTLSGRWQLLEYYLSSLYHNGHEFTLVDLARELSNDSNDPNFIARVLIDHFVSKTLQTPSDYDIATDIFKWDVPQNYYDDGTWNLSWSTATNQCLLLLIHIGRMPEFQLK